MGAGCLQVHCLSSGWTAISTMSTMYITVQYHVCTVYHAHTMYIPCPHLTVTTVHWQPTTVTVTVGQLEPCAAFKYSNAHIIHTVVGRNGGANWCY